MRIERQFVRNQMVQNFRVGFPSQMEVGCGQDLFTQLGVIGQLTVEGKAEPFSPRDVLTFKWLSVAGIVCAAGGIANMTDGRLARMIGHERLVRAFMIHAKDFGHTADVFMSLNELQACRIVAGEPRGQLATVLHVQQHAGDQTRCPIPYCHRFFRCGIDIRFVFLAQLGNQRTEVARIQMIHGGYAAFVLQFVHNRRVQYSRRRLTSVRAETESRRPCWYRVFLMIPTAASQTNRLHTIMCVTSRIEKTGSRTSGRTTSLDPRRAIVEVVPSALSH